MKITSTLVVILLLQAALAIVIFADIHPTSVGEGQEIDINPGKLKCCTDCSFSFSGLYTCDDIVVDKCDHICKNCLIVKAYPMKEVKCADTFLGICDSQCK